MAFPAECRRISVVAAIDMLTADTGVVFSCISQPSEVLLQHWEGAKQTAPTCVLFTMDKKFTAFGFKAEEQYKDRVQEGTHGEVYYFKNFGSDLFKTGKGEESMLQDVTGKEMKSTDVLSACIRYLYDRFLAFNTSRKTLIEEDEIGWVITVPATWNNGRMHLIRTTAVHAGIEDKRLLVVKESEVAVRCCYLYGYDDMKVNIKDAHFNAGSLKCILLNAGRDSVCVTIYNIYEGNYLVEFQRNFDHIGSSNIDAAFRKLLAGIFGDDVMNNIKVEYSDILDMYHDFRIKARSKQTSEFRIKLPNILLDNKSKYVHTENRTEETTGINIRRNSIVIKSDVAKSLIYPTCENVVHHLKQVIEKSHVPDLSTIMMVGQFSKYHMLQDCVKEAFPNKRVIIPEDPSSVVMRGAVIYGHQGPTPSSLKKRFSEK